MKRFIRTQTVVFHLRLGQKNALKREAREMQLDLSKYIRWILFSETPDIPKYQQRRKRDVPRK